MRRARCCGSLRTQGNKLVRRCAPGPDRQCSLVPSNLGVTDLFFVQVYLSALLLQRDSKMSGSSVAELEHSAFEMSVYEHCPTAPIKTTTSGSEDCRMKALPSGSPRAPKITEFFTGVALIANRAISWVKRAIEDLGQIISAGQYWLASEESMLSVKLAIASKHPNFIKAQFVHLIESLERRSSFLASQDPAFAKRVNKRFWEKLNILVESNREVLEDHRQMMARRSVCFQSCIPGRNELERGEFGEAWATIDFLLLKNSLALAKKKAAEAAEREN